MTFDVVAEDYDRFMGRYSVQLAHQLADLAGVTSGQRALDVGCGSGALTNELVARLGSDSVAAVDPSASLAAAAADRHPGVDVRQASAEELPFANGTFDATLAQLVVHLLPDPVRGLREMARVTRAGGVVAACVWDHAGGRGPASVFWRSARERDADVVDQSDDPGAREGHLVELLGSAGLREVKEATLVARVEHPTFDDWWVPFTFGVGPAGAYAATLDAHGLAELGERCRRLLPEFPFTQEVSAWAVRGVV